MIEIDNNAAERALRGVTLGRKNDLFARSDSGGEHTATIQSPTVSTKLNGVNPEAHLLHVLTHIARQPVNRANDFLPKSASLCVVAPASSATTS